MICSFINILSVSDFLCVTIGWATLELYISNWLLNSNRSKFATFKEDRNFSAKRACTIVGAVQILSQFGFTLLSGSPDTPPRLIVVRTPPALLTSDGILDSVAPTK